MNAVIWQKGRNGNIMFIKLLVVIIGVSALILTFRSEAILKKLLKISEPSKKQILTLKLIALAIAVILFSAVLIFNN